MMETCFKSRRYELKSIKEVIDNKKIQFYFEYKKKFFGDNFKLNDSYLIDKDQKTY